MVELLVVMAVIAVMAGLAATAFKPNNEIAVSSAASQVSGVISGARQLAIAKNCRTRFIIVTDSSSNPDWKLRKYGVLKIKDNTADTTDEPQFVPASRMESLATGVYFRKNTHNTNDPESGGKSMFDASNVDQINLQGSDAEYAYIEFLPTGGTSGASTANVFEVERAPSADQSIADNKNYVRVGVAQYTGRVKFERPNLK